MKTNVTFLKVPDANVKIYFKKPNKLKIKNEKGISFVPKGAVSINLNNILSGNEYTAIDAGTDKIGNTTVRVIKLLPEDDKQTWYCQPYILMKQLGDSKGKNHDQGQW